MGIVARRGKDGRERLAERPVGLRRGAGKDVAARRFGERRRVAFFEHLEMAGDVRLERELVEEPFAEGVDGLDLQPARRLQGAREKPAGAGELALIGLPPLDLEKLAGELRIAHGRPAGEAFEDAGRHLRRRRLGEGQAEDAAGVGAGEEEPDDAAGKHEGLAGAGIGRHPGRRARIGGVCLRLARGGVDGDYGRTGAAQKRSSSLSTRPHSRTRARWS